MLDDAISTDGYFYVSSDGADRQITVELVHALGQDLACHLPRVEYVHSCSRPDCQAGYSRLFLLTITTFLHMNNSLYVIAFHRAGTQYIDLGIYPLLDMDEVVFSSSYPPLSRLGHGSPLLLWFLR